MSTFAHFAHNYSCPMSHRVDFPLPNVYHLQMKLQEGHVSQVSVCHSVEEGGGGRRGLHVTITQTWDLPPPLLPPDIGLGYLLPAPASPLDMGSRTSPLLLTSGGDQWTPVQTCSLEDLLPPLLTSSGY